MLRSLAPRALASTTVLALGLAACGEPSRRASKPAAAATMPERLRAQATRSDRALDPMASSLRVAAMKAEPLPADPNARIPAQVRLAIEMFRAGRTDEAIALFDSLYREVSRFDAPGVEQVQLAMLDWASLARITAAIRDWCLAGPPADRCRVPPSGGVPVARRDDARAAVGILGRLLEARPDDLASRWLLNLGYLALGEYPAGVPARWLIPPGAFASEYPLPRFPDAAPELGLDVKGHAGGAIMDDFDGDGRLDLFVSSMGLDDQSRLFLADGRGGFADRTTALGLEGQVGGLNAIQADYDNDGDLDILILRGGWDKLGGQPSSLLRNDGKAGFTDVTEIAGLLANRSTQTAAWGDYDNDGWLDLYIGLESSDRASTNQLFHNNRNGTFTDVTRESGTGVAGYTKGVAWGDIDNDGRIDLYVSRMDGPNVLLHNDGPGSGGGAWHFSDVTARAGVAEPTESFSTWFWDYDDDGWLDLFVFGYRYLQARNVAADVTAEYLGRPSQAELPRLYRNRHDGTFEDVTRKVRLDRVLFAMGANFGDLDNDGYPDLYAATGDPDFRSIVPNRMLRNDGGRRFQDVTTAGGFGLLTKGHGVAFGDLDGDGDQDVFVNMGGMFEADVGRSVLFMNPGSRNHWITLRLEGVGSNRAAIGARVKVLLAGGPGAVYGLVSSGGSFGGNSLQQELGLGRATAIRAVEVAWPGGKTETWTGLELDRTYLLRQGDPAARAR